MRTTAGRSPRLTTVRVTAGSTRAKLPAGSFARVDPQVTRTVVNRGDRDALVLIASAPRKSGYEPMEWA